LATGQEHENFFGPYTSLPHISIALECRNKLNIYNEPNTVFLNFKEMKYRLLVLWTALLASIHSEELPLDNVPFLLQKNLARYPNVYPNVHEFFQGD
jgi:hypothetical protein